MNRFLTRDKFKGGLAREAAMKALVRFEQDKAYLNLVLPPLLQSLPEKEKALARIMAVGTVQHLNSIDWALQCHLDYNLETLTPWIRNLLRIGGFQLLYLDRVPVYAIVNEAVNLARLYGHRGTAGLTNALLRKLAAEKNCLPWPDPRCEPLKYLALCYSYPQWLVKRKLKILGYADAEKWCQANSNKPPLTIRVNSSRAKPDELMVKLQNENIITVQCKENSSLLFVKSGAGKLAESNAFKEGLITIQGQSAALIAPLLNPQPKENIVDLCSAPGGKTTQLAELQQDQGQIFAVELHQSRINLIQKAITRLGLKSIKIVQADGREIESLKLPAADAVLVDAPCSGLGVIRRLPEIKWRRSEKDLPGFQQLQQKLLAAGASQLRPGGRLLYSVCTNEPEETTQVVKAFSQDHPHFLLQPLSSLLPEALQPLFRHSVTLDLLPHRHNLDGFFVALWVKQK